MYGTELPQCFQDVVSVSALYLSKSDKNGNLVLNVLENKANILIHSCPTALPIIEHLASVQALVVYQIIRLFDGDIRQRGLAERQKSRLDEWTTRLHQRMNEAVTCETPQSPWRTWLLCESIRRTVLTSMLVGALYTFIKEGHCAAIPQMSRVPVTPNMELWNMNERQWLQALLVDDVTTLQTYRDYAQGWYRTTDKLLAQDSFEACLLALCKEDVLQIIET